MKRRIITIIIIVGILSGATIFDTVRAQSFKITVLSVSPNPAVADGRTPVKLKVQLTNSTGKPVEGHNLFALSRNGGSFKANRIKTDSKGFAEYTYFPYKASQLVKLNDVIIDIGDESNSVFVEINTSTSRTIALKAPEQESTGNTDLDSIFGE